MEQAILYPHLAGSNMPVMMKHDDMVGTEGTLGTAGTGISIK